MEGNNSLDQVTQSVRDRATVRTVFGEPVETHGKTIIPVARVAYGFGGGHGHGRGRNNRHHELGEGEGEGAGGGMMVSPTGVMEITDEYTHYIALTPARKVIVAALLGMFAGFMFGGRRVKRHYRKKMAKMRSDD